MSNWEMISQAKRVLNKFCGFKIVWSQNWRNHHWVLNSISALSSLMWSLSLWMLKVMDDTHMQQQEEKLHIHKSLVCNHGYHRIGRWKRVFLGLLVGIQNHSSSDLLCCNALPPFPSILWLTIKDIVYISYYLGLT